MALSYSARDTRNHYSLQQYALPLPAFNCNPSGHYDRAPHVHNGPMLPLNLPLPPYTQLPTFSVIPEAGPSVCPSSPSSLTNTTQASATGNTTNTNAAVTKPKRSRKKRTVKGGYIEYDDVSNIADADYGNWIFHAKLKLKEREYKLTQLRLERVRQVVYENIHLFEAQCKPFEVSLSPQFTDTQLCGLWNGEVVDNVMFEFNEVLAAWEGVQVREMKKGVTSFRGYFDASRNWFDQKKKRIKATLFWLPILRLVQGFALQTALSVFSEDYAELQFKAYNWLFHQILYGLLTAEITFAATKAQPLIPYGTLKDMKDIKQFLLKFLGAAFDVAAMVNNHKENMRDSNDGGGGGGDKRRSLRKVGAVEVVKLLRCNLKELLVQSEQLFVGALHKLYVKVEANANLSATAHQERPFDMSHMTAAGTGTGHEYTQNHNRRQFYVPADTAGESYVPQNNSSVQPVVSPSNVQPLQAMYMEQPSMMHPYDGDDPFGADNNSLLMSPYLAPSSPQPPLPFNLF